MTRSPYTATQWCISAPSSLNSCCVRMGRIVSVPGTGRGEHGRAVQTDQPVDRILRAPLVDASRPSVVEVTKRVHRCACTVCHNGCTDRELHRHRFDVADSRNRRLNDGDRLGRVLFVALLCEPTPHGKRSAVGRRSTCISIGPESRRTCASFSWGTPRSMNLRTVSKPADSYRSNRMRERSLTTPCEVIPLTWERMVVRGPRSSWCTQDGCISASANQSTRRHARTGLSATIDAAIGSILSSRSRMQCLHTNGRAMSRIAGGMLSTNCFAAAASAVPALDSAHSNRGIPEVALYPLPAIAALVHRSIKLETILPRGEVQERTDSGRRD